MDRSTQRKIVEPFYDSDEEIAWGPLTLREIKSDLKRPTRKVNRRETTIGIKSFDYEVAKENCDITNMDQNMNSSTHSSEYLTANESTSFLNKLSKVINEPCASDLTINKKSMFLDNMHMTLVENTVILSSDEEDENVTDDIIVLSDTSDCGDSNNESTENVLFKTVKSELTDIDNNVTSEISYKTAGDNRTEIDDDSGKQSTEHSDPIYTFKEDDKMDENSYHQSASVYTFEQEDNLTDEERGEITQADCKEINASLQKNVLYYEHNFLDTNTNSFDSGRENSRNSSPILVPEIDIKQFDQSDDSFSMGDGFNDTLEEIEHALKYGLNYEMPEEPQLTPQKQTVKKAEEIFKIPPTPSSASKIPVPSKTKSHHLKPSDKFKDIISPVRIYINNSPRMCLRQNIPDRKLNNPIFELPKSEIFHKQNPILHFPEVIYKPAQMNKISTAKQINLPSSIKKLVPQARIVKHEKRICQNVNQYHIQKKLIESEGDLTSIDDSQYNISILTSKEAFIH